MRSNLIDLKLGLMNIQPTNEFLHCPQNYWEAFEEAIPLMMPEIRKRWWTFDKVEEVISAGRIKYAESVYDKYYHCTLAEDRKMRIAYTAVKMAARKLGEGYWTRSKNTKKSKKGAKEAQIEFDIEIISLDEHLALAHQADQTKTHDSSSYLDESTDNVNYADSADDMHDSMCFADHEHDRTSLEVRTAVPATFEDEIDFRERLIALIKDVAERYAGSEDKARILSGLRLMFVHGVSEEAAAKKVGLSKTKFHTALKACGRRQVEKHEEWKPGKVVRRNMYQLQGGKNSKLAVVA